MTDTPEQFETRLQTELSLIAAINNLATALHAAEAARQAAPLPTAPEEPSGTLLRALEVLVDARTAAAFPLDKREVFAGLTLMGLAARLQPIQHSNTQDKQKLVDLAFEMADLAVKKSEGKGSYADAKDR